MTEIRWELLEEVHLKRFFSHFGVDCVFDVGANRGQYRDVIRKNVGYKGPIISFEPIPTLVRHMENRKSVEGDDNWFIEGLALGEYVGTTEFNVTINDKFSSLKTPDHSEIGIFREMNVVKERISVLCDTLSNKYFQFVEKLGFRRPFLKMDTQGNDLSVFRSGGSSVRDFVGLQSELSIRRIYADTVHFYEALAEYQKSGFILSALVPNTAGHFPDLVEIDCIMYKK